MGRAGGGLHAPGLREAGRGPHLPPGHHPGQPHRLAGQLLQRGPLHPGGREADERRGPAPGPVDPLHPLRAGPHRQPDPVPRRHGRAAGRPDPGVLRLPGPRARPQPDRGSHRRPLPPQLRPHRRPEGRLPQGLDRRDPGRAQEGRRVLRRDRDPAHGQRDLRAPHPGHRRHPPAYRHRVRPLGGQRPGFGHRLRPAPRRTLAPALEPVRLQGLDPPRRGLLRPLLGPPPGGPRGLPRS